MCGIYSFFLLGILSLFALGHKLWSIKISFHNKLFFQKNSFHKKNFHLHLCLLTLVFFNICVKAQFVLHHRLWSIQFGFHHILCFIKISCNFVSLFVFHHMMDFSIIWGSSLFAFHQKICSSYFLLHHYFLSSQFMFYYNTSFVINCVS